MLIDFRELFPEYNLTFKGVLHVGANVGEEYEVYNELGIVRQIWIEANREIFTKLIEHVGNHLEGVDCYNVAAGNRWGRANLHVSNNHSQSSSVLELGTHKIEHPDVYYVKDMPVTMVPLGEYLMPYELHSVDLLNLDVQGYELEVLKGLGNWVIGFKAIYTEVNKSHVYENCVLVDDLDVYLLARGFKRVETYWAPNKTWGDALYIRV